MEKRYTRVQFQIEAVIVDAEQAIYLNTLESA